MFYRRIGRQIGPKSEPTHPLPAISRLSQETTPLPLFLPASFSPGPGKASLTRALRRAAWSECYGPRNGGVGAGWQGRME